MLKQKRLHLGVLALRAASESCSMIGRLQLIFANDSAVEDGRTVVNMNLFRFKKPEIRCMSSASKHGCSIRQSYQFTLLSRYVPQTASSVPTVGRRNCVSAVVLRFGSSIRIRRQRWGTRDRAHARCGRRRGGPDDASVEMWRAGIGKAWHGGDGLSWAP